MKRTGLSILVASIPFWFSVTGHADLVQLQEGKSYSGSIISMDSQQILLQDDNGIEIRIPRDRVMQIRMGEHVKPQGKQIQSSVAVPQASREPQTQKNEPERRGIISLFPQFSESKPAPSNSYRIAKLGEVSSLPDGTHVRLKGRYGRLKHASTGTPQSSLTWYLHDHGHELRISGPVPSGISSYSRDHWGSLIEVSGTLHKESSGVFVSVEHSKIIRRSQSPAPES